MLLLLAPRTGSKTEVSKLSESLGVSRATLYHYLDFFSQTYLIHQVRAFSKSLDVSARHNPKIYFNDTGLLNRIFQVSAGQIFENKIFNQLYTKAIYSRPSSFIDPVSYYQTKSGGEIDFIVDGKHAYEVKLSATNHDIKRLAKIALNLQIPEYSVITLASAKPFPKHIISPY